MVFGYIARHYLELALDSKVRFCSTMKPLLDTLLRLNTEEDRLVNAETELEAFGCTAMPLTDRMTHTHVHTDPTDCYNPLRMR